jgi:hypothetical protein
MADRITIRKCDFVRRQYANGERYWWFDADLARDIHPFDFVLIDGPMGRLVGRNGAIPEILPYLDPEARIYLDDCRREHEARCIAEWQRHFPGITVHQDRGLGRISTHG